MGSCNMFLVLFVLNTLHLQLAASCSSQATNPRHNPVVQTVPSPLVKQSVRRESMPEKYPDDVVQQIIHSPLLSGMFDSPVSGVESSLMSSKTSGFEGRAEASQCAMP